MSISSAPRDELAAAIAALDPETTDSEWRHDISSDLEFTLSAIAQNWPELRDDEPLLRAIRMLIRHDAEFVHAGAQSGVHESCVELLCAILDVHVEDGGGALTYGAILRLDSALSNLTTAIADLKAELGARAVTS